MRRSRSAPGRGLAPMRAAISRTLRPRPRLKKKGSVMPVPPAASAGGAHKFLPAAETELLNAVVRLLRERECIVEPQRPERRFPNEADPDRTTNVHPIVDWARRRIRDARTEGRTEIPGDDLAGRREDRRAGIIP